MTNWGFYRPKKVQKMPEKSHFEFFRIFSKKHFFDFWILHTSRLPKPKLNIFFHIGLKSITALYCPHKQTNLGFYRPKKVQKWLRNHILKFLEFSQKSMFLIFNLSSSKVQIGNFSSSRAKIYHRIILPNKNWPI